MLLSDTVNPSKMLYYQGAKVLETLQLEGRMSIGLLYARMSEKEKMSYPVLILCLDWLYLIGAAIITEEGEVILCS